MSSLTNKQYLKVVIPLTLSTITQPLLGAVDTAVVGHLENPSFIGGVSLGAVMFNTIYWVLGFLGASTVGYSARVADESNDKVSLAFYQPMILAIAFSIIIMILHKHIFNTAMMIIKPDDEVIAVSKTYYNILIFGAPFVLLNYVLLGWLTGQMKVKSALCMQMTGNVLNIVLDIFFVNYLHLEVEGVATATLFAQLVSTFLGVFFLMQTKKICKVKLGIIFSLKKLQEIMATNIPLIMRTICLLIQVNIFMSLSAEYGTLVLSINSILDQIINVMSYMFNGISNASNVFSGRAKGKKNEKLLKSAINKTFLWTTVLMGITTIIYLITNNYIISLFTNIEEVIVGLNKYKYWVLLYPILSGFGFAFYGLFAGVGYTKPIRTSTFIALIIFILLCFVLKPIYGNHGIWIAVLGFYAARSYLLIPKLKDIKL